MYKIVSEVDSSIDRYAANGMTENLYRLNKMVLKATTVSNY